MSEAVHTQPSPSEPLEETPNDRLRTRSGVRPTRTPKYRSTRDIPAATTARIAGRRPITQFEFVDHHGSGCSDGSPGWFFSCRNESWDEAYAVRQVEPEFDTYLAFENPRYRPGPPMNEKTKARLRGGDRNRVESGSLSRASEPPPLRRPSNPFNAVGNTGNAPRAVGEPS